MPADRTLAILTGLTLLLAPACAKPQSTPAAPPCPPQNERYCAAATGDLLDVRLADLKPTQPSLGYDEVYYRLGRYTLGPDPRREMLDAWCATNGQTGLKSAGSDGSITDPASFDCEVPVGSETPESTAAMKTGVIGPGGQVYLTDGHHTLTSFWEAPGGGSETRIRLRITGNMSTQETGDFWRQMQDRGWAWLQDVNGDPVGPQQLPAGLGLKRFANDQYRATLYFVRDVGYAAELGKLEEFGAEAFAALSQPVDSTKPGKLALALAYKRTI